MAEGLGPQPTAGSGFLSVSFLSPQMSRLLVAQAALAEPRARLHNRPHPPARGIPGSQAWLDKVGQGLPSSTGHCRKALPGVQTPAPSEVGCGLLLDE